MKEGSICNKCNHRAYCDMGDEHNNDNATIKGCYLYSEQKTKTNADRIREMTDEELAEWLAEYAALLIANVLDDDYLVQTKSGWLD